MCWRLQLKATLEPFSQLLVGTLSKPYDNHPDELQFQQIPEGFDARYQTFGGHMKTLILFIILILIHTPGFSQNILEALALKNDLIGEYVEGEARSTDTIIDLRNAYYEEFSSYGEGDTTIIRQAAIFHNHDGSRTLGISISSWDFQCYIYETNFYEIPKLKDSINTIANDDILPNLSIREFIIDSNVFSVFE